MYKIDFYEDRDGYSEIEDFLDQLRHSHQKNNVSLLNKITKELYMLQNLGPRLREPHGICLSDHGIASHARKNLLCCMAKGSFRFASSLHQENKQN